MRTPNIVNAFTASIALHISFLAIMVIIISRQDIYLPTAPYIVSLVDGLTASGGLRGGTQAVAPKAEPARKVTKEVAPQKAPAPPPKQADKKMKPEDDKLLNDRLAALQAKKKIEKLVALRKVIDVDTARAGAAKTASKGQDQPASQGGSAGGKDYYSLVVDKIRQQWVFPENLDRDLETVVAVRISRDGRVTVERVEKSSGNPLFDRSVLRAINLASPLPSPPHDMELGVRFRP